MVLHKVSSLVVVCGKICTYIMIISSVQLTGKETNLFLVQVSLMPRYFENQMNVLSYLFLLASGNNGFLILAFMLKFELYAFLKNKPFTIFITLHFVILRLAPSYFFLLRFFFKQHEGIQLTTILVYE